MASFFRVYTTPYRFGMASVCMVGVFSSSPYYSFSTIRLHYNSSPLLFVSTTIRLHYYSSPLLFVSTTIRLHTIHLLTICLHYYSFPSLFVPTTIRLHYYLSPLLFVSTTIRINYNSIIYSLIDVINNAGKNSYGGSFVRK